MRTAGRLLFVLMLAAGAACSATPPPQPQRAVQVRPDNLDGIWNAVLRTTVPDGIRSGDRTIELQEWHLVQAADGVSGFYLALQTVSSGDGRVFICSRQPTFSNLLRISVRGRLDGATLSLTETDMDVARGECQPPPRSLTQWQGTLAGNAITLSSGHHRNTLERGPQSVAGRTKLEREAEAAFARSTEPAGGDEPGARVARGPTAPSGDVTGTWVWEHRGPAPNGDEKQEREEWHLQQEGGHIRGYYDRQVHQVSTDGQAYRCSMAMDFEITTRYRIVGDVIGDRVMLRENAFEILDPSPCDNGLRRLDTYEGSLSENELRLVFGPGGRQVLRRARPDVPTQRF